MATPEDEVLADRAIADGAFEQSALAYDGRTARFAATIENFLINPIDFFRFYPHKVWNIPDVIREAYNVLFFELAMEGWVRKHASHGSPRPDILNHRRFVVPGTPPQFYRGQAAVDSGVFRPEVALWNDPGQLSAPWRILNADGSCNTQWDAKNAIAARFPKQRALETPLNLAVPDWCAVQALRKQAENAVKNQNKQIGEHAGHTIALLREVQGMYACATARSANSYGGGTIAMENLAQPYDTVALQPEMERTYLRVDLRGTMRRNFLEGPNRYNINPERMPIYEASGNFSRQRHFQQLVLAFRNLRYGTLGATLTPSRPRREEDPRSALDWQAFAEAGNYAGGDDELRLRITAIQSFFGNFENTVVGADDGLTHQGKARRDYETLGRLTNAMIQSMNAANMSNDEFKIHLGLDDNLPKAFLAEEAAFYRIMHLVADDCQMPEEWTRLAFLDAKLRYIALRVRDRRWHDVLDAGLVWRPQTAAELGTRNGLDANRPTNAMWIDIYRNFQLEDLVAPWNINMWPPNFGDTVTTTTSDTGEMEVNVVRDPTNCMWKHFVVPKRYTLSPEQLDPHPRKNLLWASRSDDRTVTLHYNNTGVYSILFDYFKYRNFLAANTATQIHWWVVNFTNSVMINLGLRTLDRIQDAGDYLPVPTFEFENETFHEDNDGLRPPMLPLAQASMKVVLQQYRSYFEKLHYIHGHADVTPHHGPA